MKHWADWFGTMSGACLGACMVPWAVLGWCPQLTLIAAGGGLMFVVGLGLAIYTDLHNR